MTYYDRPIKAELHVVLENGETWAATDDDLVKFGVVRRQGAYMSFRRALDRTLRGHGVLVGNITDSRLNPVLHLVEIALMAPELLDHPDHDDWADVAAIERKLAGGGEPA